VPASAR